MRQEKNRLNYQKSISIQRTIVSSKENLLFHRELPKKFPTISRKISEINTKIAERLSKACSKGVKYVKIYSLTQGGQQNYLTQIT